jgi:hypothetical protein
MPTGILLPTDELDVAGFAERVETLGYDSLWVSELWTVDAFVVLTRAATVTDSLELGTAIVNVYSRSPATLAQAAATLDRVSGGRARTRDPACDRPHRRGVDSPQRPFRQSRRGVRDCRADRPRGRS